MDFFDLLLDPFLGNTLLQWIGAGLVVIVSLIALWLVQVLVVRRLRRITDASQSEVDGLAVDIVADTKWWTVVLIALYLGTIPLILPARVNQVLRAIAIIALLIQVALWGNQIIAFLLRRYVESEAEDEVGGESAYDLLNFVLRTILWSLVILMALDNLPGVEITSLIAGLGVASVAVALAVQEILGDIFASLSIVLDKPFVVGDTIEVGEFTGTVERVGIKTTRIRSVTGEELIFSNSDLLESRVRNYRRMQERRAVITLGIAYETPHDKLEMIPHLIEEEIRQLEVARFDRAHLKSMGDFALMYEVVFWVLLPDYRTYMDVTHAVNLALIKRFEQEGIDLPYPTQRLLVRSPQDLS